MANSKQATASHDSQAATVIHSEVPTANATSRAISPSPLTHTNNCHTLFIPKDIALKVQVLQISISSGL
jgi:hypothetical protein